MPVPVSLALVKAAPVFSSEAVGRLKLGAQARLLPQAPSKLKLSAFRPSAATVRVVSLLLPMKVLMLNPAVVPLLLVTRPARAGLL